jgi:hypothetical protein
MRRQACGRSRAPACERAVSGRVLVCRVNAARLSPTGAQRSLQLPAEPSVSCFRRSLLEPLTLLSQSLQFLLRPLKFSLRHEFDVLGLACAGPANRFHPSLRLAQTANFVRRNLQEANFRRLPGGKQIQEILLNRF